MAGRRRRTAGRCAARGYERSIELARIALASSKGSQAEVLAARQLLSQSKDRQLELVAQARRARSALARWIPDAASRDLPPELPSFPYLCRTKQSPPRWNTTRSRPAMHLRAQGIAEADVALAREASKPDRSVEVGYFARNGGRSVCSCFRWRSNCQCSPTRKRDRMVASATPACAGTRTARGSSAPVAARARRRLRPTGSLRGAIAQSRGRNSA